MKRRNFLAGLGLIGMPLSSFAFAELKNSLPRTDTLPALFIGHGSPMNAIENNKISKGWQSLSKSLPKPAVILCISAHWLTRGSFVSTASQPETIHDFGGFPQELFDQQYPAPGSPETAQKVIELTRDANGDPAVAADNRGLDHGT